MAKTTLKDDKDIRAEILRQITVSRSVAPRDIAMALATENEDWRQYLPKIKKAAQKLEGENTLAFIRKGKPVSSAGLKGVFRLAKTDPYQE